MGNGDEEKKFNDWESGRVTQLIYYMQDCQQGIRDTSGQILSVVAITGTMLTLFFGVSIFGDKINESVARSNGQLIEFADHGNNMFGRACDILENLLTVRRIAFWFTSIIFLVSVLYIIVLGIGNVLRYHYCQHLADRLHSLIQGAKDDNVRNALVTYEQFSSPVTTYNISHVSNSHNMLNFTAHYLACGLATLFCIGSILTQYALLEAHRWYDIFVLTLVGLTLFVAIILFIRFNWRSEDVADMAFSMANENLDVRKGIAETELYRNARYFQKALIYLIFPRRNVVHKDALIVGGFAAVSFVHGDCYPMHLVFVLFIYSFLFCQARYQLNDLRGLEEDEKAGRTDRLNVKSPVNKKYLINVSIMVCFTRVFLAVILTLFQGRVLVSGILISGALLFAFTYLYELARKRKWIWPTFLLVGAGYPLRVFVGAIAEDVDIVRAIPKADILILGILFWLWGILGSLMAWAREIEVLIREGKMKDGKHPKRHYEIMYPLLKAKFDREIQLEKSGCLKNASFLLRQYDVKDPWNICFWIILLLIEIENFLYSQSVVYFLVNTVLLLLCGLVTFRKTKRGVIFLFNLCLSFGGINVLLHCFLNDTLTPDLFGIVLALSVTASVIFIRMAPKTSIRKVLRDSIFIVKKCLFGEYVAKESG